MSTHALGCPPGGVGQLFVATAGGDAHPTVIARGLVDFDANQRVSTHQLHSPIERREPVKVFLAVCEGDRNHIRLMSVYAAQPSDLRACQCLVALCRRHFSHGHQEPPEPGARARFENEQSRGSNNASLRGAMSAVAVEPGCTRRTTLLADGSTDSRPRPESRIFVAASPSLAERDPKRAFVGGDFAQALTFALGDVDTEELVPDVSEEATTGPNRS